MRERQAERRRRGAREFEAFVAGAGGRLLHTATLLTGEAPAHNARARRLLTAALARTYAHWDPERGEDPYDRTRQELVARFAATAWRHHLHREPGGEPGVLARLTPQERLILVLRLYEGVAEEQVAALVGLPAERVRVICTRAIATLRSTPGGSRRPRPRPSAEGVL
ncbi:sigma factor-like helix-turn-helix DNA-binding protein [Streptomyces sp. NPDC059070]|uniref:sigma factor-like helix-turn-helix DNA-binding protein n=1 Tax=Streptomyces sp. NPDC059070 TaxID=3346713 RepID=UPI0036A9A7F1